MKTIILLFILILLIGCAETQTDIYVDCNLLKWDTTGGGEIKFDVKYDTNFIERFNIYVNRYLYDETNLIFQLNPTDNSNCYYTLDNIFNAKVNINGNFKESSLPTGSWTSIKVYTLDNYEHEILNIDLRNNLLELKNYVVSNIEN